MSLHVLIIMFLDSITECGAEPFVPPPVAKARPGADVKQQHPAFHDPEQAEAEGPTPQQSQTGESAATSTAPNNDHALMDSG